MTLIDNFWKGILKENPTFRLVLGMCPTLGVTHMAINGFGMGVSTLAVLLGSNVVIAAIRKFIPEKVRIPAYITVIATFVTLVDMILKAYQPELHEALGVFIPLIVVNCIILGRAEAFAGKNKVSDSLADGLGMGVGFTLSLTVLGIIREAIGMGTIFGWAFAGTGWEPMAILTTPPGAFLTLGLMMALINISYKKLGIE